MVIPVPVDGQLRATGVDGGWLYAIGDCNGLAPLTHMGKYHGRVAAAAILGRDVDPVPGDAVLVHPYAKGSWVLRKPMGCCPTGTCGTTRRADP